MNCDHCRTAINPTNQGGSHPANRPGVGTGTVLSWVWCPECGKVMVNLALPNEVEQRIYPRASARPKASPEVPAALASDYDEGCLVLGDSPMSAAALGRRCLQHLLRDHVGVKHGSLDREIQQVLDSG